MRLIRAIEGNAGLLNLATPEGAHALPGILSALADAGIPVAAVSVHRPSLDDVYLHYTGREFATEDKES